ncbi:MAG: hypothetical protein U0527_08205 [Candidatus Eisenbacteria bacterium]
MSRSKNSLEGKRGTQRRFLERWLRFRAGELFRQSRLQDRALRLERTGLFTRVDAPRVERLREGGVRVVYPVLESPRNRAVGVLGYAGRNRTVTGLAELDLGNLGGAGRSVGVRWARPRPRESRFRLEYRELLLPRLPLGGRLALEQEVRDSTYSLLVTEGSIEAPLSWAWSARAGLEFQKASLGIEPAEQHRRLSTLVGMRWEGLRRGEWRGGRFDLTVRSGRDRARAPSGRSLGSTRLTRGDLDGESLIRLHGRTAARIKMLAGAVTGADTLPASELYRLGGAGQLRGHPEAGFTARRFGIGQLELGLRSGESWAYLFADLGTLHGPGARDLWRWRSGFGVGLNPRVGSGDVSLDLAFPGALRFGEARVHLRVASRF